MKGVLRLVAWSNLLPAAVVCAIAPIELFGELGVPIDPASGPFLLRYLAVAYVALFGANAVAASRPSIWKPVLALDLVLYAGSALVPLSVRLQSRPVHWFWWANLALDGLYFAMVGVAAVRTFWMK